MEKQSNTVKRQRLEENGLYLSDPKHWEVFESTLYFYPTPQNRGTHASLLVPIDLVRHLGLKHKEKIVVAIRKKEIQQ